jgi:hypothetical protein
MNGFKKNKNGTTKRTARQDENTPHVYESTPKEYKPITYLNEKNKSKK